MTKTAPDMLFDFPPSCEKAIGTGAAFGRGLIAESISADVINSPQEGLAFICGGTLSGLMALIDHAEDKPGEPLNAARRTALLMVYLRELKQQMTLIEQQLCAAPAATSPTPPTLIN